MPKPQQIESVIVEIHRGLGASGTARKGETYIALVGTDQEAQDPKMPMDQEELLNLLFDVRYERGVNDKARREALKKLGDYAAEFLPDLPTPVSETATQIDLVMGASELWAFPFEACQIDGKPVFADDSKYLILTRRIRQEFAGHLDEWPVVPRVAFIHAPAADDLSQEWIDRHLQALENALEPWSKKANPQADELLVRTEVGSPRRIQNIFKSKDGKPYTHVHILAHGKAIEDRRRRKVRWGLRLGPPERNASDPEALAEALLAGESVPVVVTVAACDAANQEETAIAQKSFAQELHGRGVPIVIASQLPLTKPGAVTLTETFYRHLLGGDDARVALHRARVELWNRQEGHDWASMVGYVRLPEGYNDHLLVVGLQREMARLRALRSRMDSEEFETTADYDLIGNELRERIDVITDRLKSIPTKAKELRTECQGILASAYKRFAELLSRKLALLKDQDEQIDCRDQIRQNLQQAFENYRDAYHENIHEHWTGVQQLSLAAVLHGAIDQQVLNAVYFAARLAIASSEVEFWACGTLVEVYLLQVFDGEKEDSMANAVEAIKELKDRSSHSPARDAPYAIPSTREQLQRYVDWWTIENEFFPNSDRDLTAEAQRLIKALD